MVQRIRKVQNERHEDGFTLIELLIVIVVLGILAGIVVLGLGTFREDANTAACKADLKQVQIASDAFIAQPGQPDGRPGRRRRRACDSEAAQGGTHNDRALTSRPPLAP